MKTRTMTKVLRATTVAALLGLAPLAQAADTCLNVGGPTYIGKAFKVPPPGRCKPFYGFAIIGMPNSVTGSGCTASDNKHVYFTLTTMIRNPGLPAGSNDSVGFDAVSIPLPLFSGAGTDDFSTTGGFHSTLPAYVENCFGSNPIP